MFNKIYFFFTFSDADFKKKVLSLNYYIVLKSPKTKYFFHNLIVQY